MKQKPNLRGLARLAATIFCAAIGGGLAVTAMRVYQSMETSPELPSNVISVIYIGMALLFAIITWFISPSVIRLLQRWTGTVEGSLSDTPLPQLLSGAIGLIVGLVIATLFTQLFRAGLPEMLWGGLSAIVYLIMGYMGAAIGSRRWRELPFLFSKQPRVDRKISGGEGQANTVSKILDTSVIIDGRILDVCKTGFVEGPMVIPQFVLAELQHIADSSDPLRRNRGRRGLDILAAMQNELEITVQITDADFEDVAEVDVKLLKLAQQIGGVVVTNDFNLNKVASVTGVKVLNLNDLAGALRPVLLPGEEMTVHILREGKEHAQGVGYLDDGTMIVVDNGKRYIGQTIDVVVTTVLQTSAGRMIFTKVKDAA